MDHLRSPLPRRSIALCVGLWLPVIPGPAMVAGAQDRSARSTVITLAGDGRIGPAGGAALESHFVLPVGVSAAPDGSIIVTDAGANAIYRLAGATVDRIAGAISQIHDSAGAPGGYRDGPALLARFDRPGAAIARADGAILVADSGNHCIRLIAHGVVSTYAGSTTPGSADGDRKTATFDNPGGLALAPDGAVLVSDFPNGIRRIAPDGTVTTLPTAGRNVYGIAASRIRGHDVIAYTDRSAIHLIVDGKEQSVDAASERMPKNEGVPIFHGWGIAILNENTVAVSDVITNVIRLVRFPTLPFTIVPASEALSGTLHEDTDYHGGFRDGTQSQALYHAPRGLALDARGQLIIADSGNRRIRLLSGFSAEQTALPDFSNFDIAPGSHNVVLIGQSLLFNGVLWNDSVPYVAEKTFADTVPAGAVTRPVRFEAIRIDGAGPQTMFDVADNYVVGRANVDAIVFFFTANAYATQKQMVAEADKLAKSQIKTIVYLLPEERELSIGELPYDSCACVLETQTIENERAYLVAVGQQYSDVGIQTESFARALVAAEQLPDADALFDMADVHYTPQGQRLIGRDLGRTLANHRAWLADRAPTFSRLPDPVTPCPTLALDVTPGAGSVDALSTGPEVPKALAAGETVSRGDSIDVTGWAFSTPQSLSARRICPVIDGFTGLSVRGDQHVSRPDVVHALKNGYAQMSGFELSVDTQSLSPGRHALGFAVLPGDGKAYPIGNAVDVTLK